MTKRLETIRHLNDDFRRSFRGGRVLTTSGIAALPGNARAAILRRVMAFDAFTTANDPRGEHDFGNLVEGGHRVFWKIDYYDPRMEFGSEDPSDPVKTLRVLTIMLAEEY